ncbi:hypothetical protein [Burkholderia gladioli]|uniref:hypothetical protein n=1 Tax=Burkholderia gladioli TaxID=28095 RepID=UPI001C26E75C|nr:hypothetical protein [Burkholderia gladioli]MBU9385771.1 hypothetical protein [Burkholderia gladioli]
MNLEHDVEHQREHGVRFADLPNEARAAWAHKVTMAGAQTAFDFGCMPGWTEQ